MVLFQSGVRRGRALSLPRACNEGWGVRGPCRSTAGRRQGADGRHARVDVLRVSASLSSVPAYERYGFACAGEAAESSGLRYQPMDMQLMARP